MLPLKKETYVKVDFVEPQRLNRIRLLYALMRFGWSGKWLGDMTVMEAR